jgi:hypothetical protein
MRPAPAWWAVAGVALAILPAIVGIPYYLVHGRRYHPWSDHALIELQVRQIGHHPVLTGPFSREGWHHPGPALYYLLVGPYHLLGESSAAMPLTALLVNAVCVVTVAVLVRGRFGTGPALVALAVLTLYLHLAAPGFWRDVWNPNLPVLPFLVMVLLCWEVLEGAAGRFPVAVGLGSFCMQSHLGFVLPVGAVLGVTALASLLRPAFGPDEAGTGTGRFRLSSRLALVVAEAGRRRRVVIVSVVVAVVMWAPPAAQQVFGHQGNLSLIWDYLRTHSSTTSLWDATRITLSEIGAVPGFVAGRTPFTSFVTFPAVLPAWTGLVSLVAFAGAVAVAVRLRHGPLLRLAGLTAVVCVSAVAAISRIVGPIFAYLVQWTAVGGILLWTTVGATVVVALRRLAARRAAQGLGRTGDVRGMAMARMVGCLAALAAIGTAATVTTADTSRFGTPGQSADVDGVSRAVLAWLGTAHRHDTVRVDIAPSGGTALVDPSLLLAPGVVLDLRKHGVQAVVAPGFENAYGAHLVEGWQTARWLVVVAYSPTAHLPPGAGAPLGGSGGYTVYGARNPIGS